jgi:hypothetical protein
LTEGHQAVTILVDIPENGLQLASAQVHHVFLFLFLQRMFYLSWRMVWRNDEVSCQVFKKKSKQQRIETCVRSSHGRVNWDRLFAIRDADCDARDFVVLSSAEKQPDVPHLPTPKLFLPYEGHS